MAGRLKPDRQVNLTDAWDGVHFLLSPRRRAGAVGDTGDPFGLGLFGSDPMNPWVLDRHNIVRCLDAGAVARVDRELQKVSGGQLRHWYDPAVMDELGVLPGGWQQRGEEGFEYLLDGFLQWRELYHRAAEEAQAMVCVLK